ncbi:cytochrome c peroxidase [Haliangium ochraceum]|uniref:Cytochrome c domain-containing protein n=1 Tax=Haliangium ochraceum (strain DSM 14365 / JCM 11303 / SMP-2) TaxID=502025 RepID=D0LVK5_HALO1|nr:cytochrome c peroxidase [Haliangium ochraceum]ACY17566.1 conserved hypothetical protein [Haliangium ochraceum DSM 14365]
MKKTIFISQLVALALPLGLGLGAGGCTLDEDEPPATGEAPLDNNQPFANELGAAATFSTAGEVDLGDAFARSFGENQRSCASCHDPAAGWSLSLELIRERFDSSDGTAPLFRLIDGANAPTAAVASIDERREAYSMLLSRGVIRIGLPIPEDAEFELVAADDPYGYASASELSLFRRPLPATNLAFVPAVMWDGRVRGGATLEDDLAAQADDATMGHAEAITPLPARVRSAIVDFESRLFSAQTETTSAGALDAAGGRGGPEPLAEQSAVSGRFDIFDAWSEEPEDSPRAAVVRGQAIFNLQCGGCHNLQNVGTSLAPLFFDIWVSAPERRTPDMPLYTLRNLQTGELRQTTDPGRALVTGAWADVGRFKTPTLRALAARAPYFHNGAAATLDEVLEHYEDALDFVFSEQERRDLLRFLEAL